MSEHDCEHGPDHLHEPDGGVVTILPAEFIGVAQAVEDMLDIGGLPVRVPWYADGEIAVFVRRSSRDLSIIEIHMARHDGLMQEEMDEQHRQADAHPGGPKEYWRGEMVGTSHDCGKTAMTNEEFEQWWEEDEED